MIKFGKLGFTLELRNDRSDLDFYSAFEDVAVYFFEFGARQTWSNTLKVGEHDPSFCDRLIDGESVI